MKTKSQSRKRSRRRFNGPLAAAGLPIIGLAAGAAVAAAVMVARPVRATIADSTTPHVTGLQTNGSFPAFAQDGDDQDSDNQVQTKQVAKYVAVYKAMQKNHGLTVDQACAQQGLTVAQFRGIEDKVERDDALRALVRKALNPADKSPSDDDGDN